jgi:hypothetical protein
VLHGVTYLISWLVYVLISGSTLNIYHACLPPLNLVFTEHWEDHALLYGGICITSQVIILSLNNQSQGSYKGSEGSHGNLCSTPHPDRLWDPPSLLFNGYKGPFPWV